MIGRSFFRCVCFLIAAWAHAATVRSEDTEADRAVAFLAAVDEHFAGWDGDADGTLSVAELDTAVADSRTRGHAAAAIAALKRASRSRRYQLPPLTAANIRALVTAKPGTSKTGSAIDDIARGGSAGTMLSYITGHKIQRFSCKFARDESLSFAKRDAVFEQFRSFLHQADKQRRPMTCGTEKTTTPGLTPNHAYAILGYDSDGNRLRLWNPHGSDFTPKGPVGLENGYPRKDGVFEMPLSDFVLQFAGLAVETDLPAGDEAELPRLP